MSNSKKQRGIIKDVFVGEEDRGITTCSVGIEFKGSYQSFGNLCLTKDDSNDYLELFTKDICNVFGVTILKAESPQL